MYDDEVIKPWFDHLVAPLPGLELFDIHTHIGFNDPDGFKMSGPELVGELAAAGSRGAVMPMHEPEGYPAANDAVLEAAGASNGRLVAFCRLDPNGRPVPEASRCLEAGARGIKLHPRAEGFELRGPDVEAIFRLAHERRLPVVIHAGRGIPTLGRDAVGLAQRYPDARIVLAHAAICDLNWLWREIPRHPNLFIDTSWWNPADVAAMFALVPPGQLLYATDLPYFTPFLIATMVARYGRQTGLSDEQIVAILGGQARRLVEGEEPLDLGPPAGSGGLAYDVVLERLTSVLMLAVARMMMGRTGYEPLQLARLACDVGDPDAPEAGVCRNVLSLLERQERFVREHPKDGAPFGAGVRTIILAAAVARTPGVTLPRIEELEDPERFRRASGAGHRVPELAGIGAGGRPRGSSGADHQIIDPESFPPPVPRG